MVTTPREIRVVASPASTAWSQAFEIVMNPLFCLTLFGSSLSLGWKPKGAGETLMLAFFVLITMLAVHTAILKLIQCRQVWRFEEGAAVLMTGKTRRSFPYQGLTIHPHWLAIFAWAVRQDGSRERIPLPSYEGELKEAFLGEMSRRGVEIRFKEWTPATDPQPSESLRSHVKDSPLSFANDEAPFPLLAALLIGLIGWGAGYLWIGLIIAAGLTAFTLMLYPNAFRLVKKRAAERPLNELLYDVRFKSGQIAVLSCDGSVWEADLCDLEMVEEERLAAGGLYEHRLGLRRGADPLFPLTEWGKGSGGETGKIRASLAGRGVPFRAEVIHGG